MFYNALNIFIFEKKTQLNTRNPSGCFIVCILVLKFFYAGLGQTKDNNYLNTLTNKVLLRLNNPITLQDT